ncbi:MAG: hypothetical protein ACI4WS_14975 [Oscillospiraceae bacterium]
MALKVDIGYFRTIQNGIGAKHRKDIKLSEAQQRFADRFEDSFNYEYDITRNEAEQQFIVAPSHNDKNKCSIFPRPGEELNMGDIIYWHKIHWLVTDIDFSDSITRSGIMERCNRTIQWQNPETREIQERWCIATKPYTSNIDKGKEVNTSNREFKIQIPFDEETSLVDVDKRFLLETISGHPKAYKCTCVDTVTNKYQDIKGGFLIWNLTQSEYNDATDNVELMIADYIEPETPVHGNLEINYAGSPEIRAGGSAKSFKATPTTVWSVNAIPEVMRHLTVSQSGGILKIRAARQSDIIGANVLLTATDGSNMSTLTVRILGGM